MCAVIFAFASPAHAGRFLPHGKHLSLPAKVAYFQRSVRHERQVVAWLESRQAPRTLERRSELRWAKAALRWHRNLVRIYTAKLPPPHPSVDSCLDTLIRREGGYNAQKWNGGYVGPWDPYSTHGGSGAYGAPQALPGNKMSSAGPDWATNIWTQIRWMVGYVNGRYGSSCAALDAWNRQGWY